MLVEVNVFQRKGGVLWHDIQSAKPRQHFLYNADCHRPHDSQPEYANTIFAEAQKLFERARAGIAASHDEKFTQEIALIVCNGNTPELAINIKLETLYDETQETHEIVMVFLPTPINGSLLMPVGVVAFWYNFVNSFSN